MPESDRQSAYLHAALARIAPFDQIPAEDLRSVAEQSHIKHCPAGTIILDPDMGPPEAFYVILSGQVHGLTPDKQAKTVWTLSEGDSFPLGALLDQRAVTTRQKVAEDAELIVIPAPVFEQLLAQSDAFAGFARQRLGYLINRPQKTGSSAEPNILDTQTPVSKRIEAHPPRMPADTPLAQAARALEQAGREALLVDFPDSGRLGLVTLRDLAFRGLARERGPNTPIGELASMDPVAIKADQSVLDAAIMLAEYGFHHLLVTDNNQPVGILAESDLYRVNRATPGVLKARIFRADSVDELEKLRQQIPAISAELVESGVKFASTSQIISGLNEAIAQRV
ncbi:MAG TPA: CBS domain-containing protein, partial [Halothiobacillaceae bacterium]|nr:CBS domain-containing protein [Halothiobacillaceae bacterium]